MGKRRDQESTAIAVRLATDTAATAVTLATKTAETTQQLMLKLTADSGDLRAHERVCVEQNRTMTENIMNMRKEIHEGREVLKKELQKDIKQVKSIVVWVVGILTTANAGLITVLAIAGWTFFKEYLHIK